MGFLDFLLGRKEQSPTNDRSNQRNGAPARSDDEIAVERYQYLLRTAPPETIEAVHTEAFSKLTDEQRDILFRQLTENVEPSERPADAAPATLAQAATRAELRQPGTLNRSFGNQNGMGFGGMMGSSLLGTVAGFVIGSALVSAFMPMDGGGTDAGADANTETNADAASDAGGDSGGDFGGGDFGGDFGF
ncbi:hypothetical protein [Cryobacterium sp. Y82]|uniref:hypothetical protein n=1 Tax=Cryobacterium sp. Y82 TaxID=2045017 RepID=UPI000CE2E929|nr:hypothetical protein [Cryobacterium sp. Y82]